jgi:pilus assembly protein CpaE
MQEQSVNIDVFTEDENNFKALVRIIRPLGNFTLRRGIDEATSDILIYELGEDAQKDFAKIELLMNSKPNLIVFITTKDPDKTLLLKAMRMGVKEFIIQPFDEKEIKDTLNKLMDKWERKQEIPQRSGKIIDVMGSKGGVGTTTVAVNLAANLAAMDNGVYEVALVDMNMIFGDIPLFLNLQPAYNWGEITKNIQRLDAAFLMNILTKHSSGLHVLPSPTYLDGNQPYSPDTVSRLLGLMKGMFDFVVIDSGQSLTDVSLSILDRSDKIFLVSLLDLTCLSNTSKLIKSFANIGYNLDERFHIIINRYLKQSDISVGEAEKLLKRKIFWTIPNDYKTTISAINQGKTLNQIAAKSETGRSLELLAGTFGGEGGIIEKKRWKIF